jgi:hypothetical protein
MNIEARDRNAKSEEYSMYTPAWITPFYSSFHKNIYVFYVIFIVCILLHEYI